MKFSVTSNERHFLLFRLEKKRIYDFVSLLAKFAPQPMDTKRMVFLFFCGYNMLHIVSFYFFR